MKLTLPVTGKHLRQVRHGGLLRGDDWQETASPVKTKKISMCTSPKSGKDFIYVRLQRLMDWEWEGN